MFGGVYPELVSARDKIHSVIAEEEASFSRTLVKGIERFQKLAAAAEVELMGCSTVSLWRLETIRPDQRGSIRHHALAAHSPRHAVTH
jgi:alanyl-tRNA synthetase